MRPHSPRRTRRAFLAAAALAPAAVTAAAQEAPPPAAPAPPAVPESLRDIRAFAVPLGTEPAFVFRALGGGAK